MSHNLKMSVDKTRQATELLRESQQHLAEHSRTLDRGLAAENLELRGQVEALRGQVEALNERLVQERAAMLAAESAAATLQDLIDNLYEPALNEVASWVDKGGWDWSELFSILEKAGWQP